MRNLRGLFWLLVICVLWLFVAAGYALIFMFLCLADVLLWIIMPWFDERFFEDLE